MFTSLVSNETSVVIPKHFILKTSFIKQWEFLFVLKVLLPESGILLGKKIRLGERPLPGSPIPRYSPTELHY